MEFIDLKKQYEVLKENIDKAVNQVLTKSNYILGEEVTELEKRLAEYVGVKHCITCGNGTDALSLVLDAWNIGAGDAVFVPTFTFFATAEVVSLHGGSPIFVDCDERTFNMSAESLERAIKKVLAEGKLTPRVIITVDLFGLLANYPEIENIAKKYNLLVLEDGAQGFGGTLNEKRACSFGHAATTSFFPAKPLGCYGDGGAMFTNDDELASLLRSLRFHGKGDDKYDNVRIGYNSRLDTIQAAILLEKLAAFEEYELTARHKWAALYNELLSSKVKTPFIPKGYTSSYAQYTLLLDGEDQRIKIQKALKSLGIPTMIYYPKCMHQQTAYQDYNFNLDDLKTAEMFTRCVLSIPMHPYLTEEQIKFIAAAIINNL